MSFELTNKLELPIFTKKDIPITYRTLNHYDELGLLLKTRQNTSKWRKLNGFEYIWINIIIVLRDIGMPIKKLHSLKEKIFEEGISGYIDKASFINKPYQDEIISSITEKYELYLLVFNDCSYTFHDSLSLKQWQNSIYKNEPHINVPLSNIIEEVLIKLECLT